MEHLTRESLALGNIRLHQEVQQQKTALQESEEKFRKISASAQDAIIMLDPKGRIAYWNHAAERILGYSSEEVRGQDGHLLLAPPASHQAYREGYARFRTTGQGPALGQTLELVAVRKDGMEIPIELSVSTIQLKDQWHSLGVLRDITERRETEERVRRQKSLLEAINQVFKRALSCETVAEVARTCLAVAEEMTGSSFGFIGEVNEAGLMDTLAISNPGWEACAMLESEAVRAIQGMPLRGIDRSVIREGTSRIVTDFVNHPDRVGTPEGHPPLTAFLGVPLKQGDKTIGMIGLANKESGYNEADQQAVEALSGAFVEALQRQRIEESLRSSEERYRTLVEAAPQAVVVTDLEGNITYASSRTLVQHGFEREEEVLGRSAFEFIAPEDQGKASVSLQRTLQDDVVRDVECRLRKKDGTWFFGELSAALIRDSQDQPQAFMGITRDITERKRMEEGLKRSLQENQHLLQTVQQQQQQLRSLAARLAEGEEKERKELARELHDGVIQNLSTAGLHLQALGSQSSSAGATQPNIRLEDSLRLVEETIEYLRSMMTELRPPLLDDYGLLAALRWFAQQFSERTGIPAMVEGEEPTPPLSPEVAIALFRTAQEALTNVSKHAPDSPVQVWLEEVGETVRLSIADEGPGFDPTTLPPPGRKHGWGLISMRERAAAVGGSLHLESTPGQGTRVEIEITR